MGRKLMPHTKNHLLELVWCDVTLRVLKRHGLVDGPFCRTIKEGDDYVQVFTFLLLKLSRLRADIMQGGITSGIRHGSYPEREVFGFGGFEGSGVEITSVKRERDELV